MQLNKSTCNVSGEGFPKPPVRQQCPLCMYALPLETNESMYMSCCGKTICLGCLHQSHKWAATMGLEYTCAFCRCPDPKGDDQQKVDDMWNARLFNRVQNHNDPKAMYCLALAYLDGDRVPHDVKKGIEYLRKGADLGSPQAARSLSAVYREGYPGAAIDKDPIKEKRYLEIAAYRGGDDRAWHNLGVILDGEGKSNDSIYHFCTAASYGNDESMKAVKAGYGEGDINPKDYDRTLGAWKRAQREMTTEDRKEAMKRFPGGGSIYM